MTMKFYLPILAAAIGFSAMPAFAQSVCIGPDCGRHDRGVYREHYREHEGCRQITVRERRGDEVVVKHIRRCD
jgi:hypothetical protein